MANLSTQIVSNTYIAQGIGDISGATKSLKTAQSGLGNYTLRAVVPASGSTYFSQNGTVGAAAFQHLFSFLKLTEYYYDFATDGGAVGTITLRGPQLPATAVVCGGRWFPTTAFTSGGSATISLGTASGSAANLLAATAIGTAGTVGVKAIIPVMTAATDVTLSANSSPVIAVGTAALTAGAGKLVLFYFTQEADTTSVA